MAGSSILRVGLMLHAVTRGTVYSLTQTSAILRHLQGSQRLMILKSLLQCLQDINLIFYTSVPFLPCGDSRCGVCPDGWMWWRGHCYFFSFGLQEDRQWNESAEFCQGHNSSLADFIQDVMRKFPRFPFLWVGLTDTQQEGRWMWRDGTDIQHYML
uniref:C-type lectin domain-containing protein n=1 Tax=Stegastes partitus TaxID=144197 RepID=A0A3B5AW81_9TELE